MGEVAIFKIPPPREDTPELRAAMRKASVAFVRERLADTSTLNIKAWVQIGIELKGIQKKDGTSFRSMFAKNSKEREDKTKYPFARTAGQMFMQIAQTFEVATSGGHSSLPSSWRTLFVLTKLPVSKIEQFIESGAIHPLMTRAEAAKLANPNRKKTTTIKPWSTTATKGSSKEDRIAAVRALASWLGLKLEDLNS